MKAATLGIKMANKLGTKAAKRFGQQLKTSPQAAWKFGQYAVRYAAKSKFGKSIMDDMGATVKGVKAGFRLAAKGGVGAGAIIGANEGVKVLQADKDGARSHQSESEIPQSFPQAECDRQRKEIDKQAPHLVKQMGKVVDSVVETTKDVVSAVQHQAEEVDPKEIGKSIRVDKVPIVTAPAAAAAHITGRKEIVAISAALVDLAFNTGPRAVAKITSEVIGRVVESAIVDFGQVVNEQYKKHQKDSHTKEIAQTHSKELHDLGDTIKSAGQKPSTSLTAVTGKDKQHGDNPSR